MSIRCITILIAVFLICHPGLQAQADQEFWFAAPDVSNVSGDTAIILVLGSTGLPSDVSISQPANPAFVPILLDLAPSEMEFLDLSQFRSDFENTPANTVLNKGILITSSNPVTAYYRITNSRHADDYNLKGRQALGREFYIPGQTEFRNQQGQSSFDIVATQNQTTITITPSGHITGHQAGIPFSVVLNRGETYSCQEVGNNPTDHLVGSYITSDRPIAVTVSDDAVATSVNGPDDLLGDQIIPMDHIGKEYIIMMGEATIERVFVTATEDSTSVSVHGQNSFNLHQGETHAFDLSLPATYISSNQPVYVWHVSGVNNQPGGALISPINCSGTSVVKFVRPASDNFFFYLLTRAGNEDNFRLNGASNIFASSFSPVPGTGNQWMAGRIEALGSLVTSTNQIDNTAGVFHMGMINYEANRQASYGYFSNFQPLLLGREAFFCAGDSLQLDAGSENSNFVWNTGDTTRQVLIHEPGIYWVTAQFASCLLSDTIVVESLDPQIDLGSDTSVCSDEGLAVNLNFPGAIYQWNDGITTGSRTLLDSGTYWVNINQQGCTASDTIRLEVFDLPKLDLGPDTILCPGQTLLLNAFEQGAEYLWQDGSVSPQFFVSSPGEYTLSRLLDGCTQMDEILIRDFEIEAPVAKDTTICLGDTLVLDASVSNATAYLWEDGSENPLRHVVASGRYFVNISNVCGAVQTDYFIDTDNCECALFVPNVFSPNQDGINDVFQQRLVCPAGNFSMVVFDRWGRKMFETGNPNEGWNGLYGNRPAQEGVYYWVIKYEVPMENRLQISRGNVTLIR